MTTPARISYGVLVLMLVLAGVLHLSAPLLAVLFSYFALRHFLPLTKRKWLAPLSFILVALGIAFCAVYFTRAALAALPDAPQQSIPPSTAFAEARQNPPAF